MSSRGDRRSVSHATTEDPAQSSGAGERDLVEAVALELIARNAAHELPLFTATSRAYFESPELVLRRVVDKEETLGFGPDAFIALTPYALAIAGAVVHFLAQQALAVAQDAGSEAVRGVLRTWIGRLRGSDPAGDPDDAGAMSLEQLRLVHGHAYDKGRQLGLSEDDAKKLADSLTGGLAGSTPSSPS